MAHVAAGHAALHELVRGGLGAHGAAAGHARGLAVADRGDEVLQQRGQGAAGAYQAADDRARERLVAVEDAATLPGAIPPA